MGMVETKGKDNRERTEREGGGNEKIKTRQNQVVACDQ